MLTEVLITFSLGGVFAFVLLATGFMGMRVLHRFFGVAYFADTLEVYKQNPRLPYFVALSFFWIGDQYLPMMAGLLIGTTIFMLVPPGKWEFERNPNPLYTSVLAALIFMMIGSTSAIQSTAKEADDLASAEADRQWSVLAAASEEGKFASVWYRKCLEESHKDRIECVNDVANVARASRGDEFSRKLATTILAFEESGRGASKETTAKIEKMIEFF